MTIDIDPQVKRNFDALTESIRRMTKIPLFMIVEDDDNDALLLTRELDRFFSKCQIMRCDDGIEALSILDRSPVDAVFLDLKMPRMGGIDLMRELRAKRNTVFVIITSVDEESKQTFEAISLGAVRIITKPVTTEKLRELFKPIC